MSAPTLRWLRIHQYEQFEPAHIDFSQRENLLLGVNGAGKTQLLKLIRAVLNLDFSQLLARTFNVEFEIQTVSAGAPDAGDVVVTGRVENVRRGPSSDPGSIALPQSNTLTASVVFRGKSAVIRCEIRGTEIAYYMGDSPEAVEKAVLPALGTLKPPYLELANQTLRGVFPTLYPRCEASFLGESDHEFRALAQSISFTVRGASSISFDVKDERGQSLGSALMWDLLPVILAVSLREQERFKAGLDLSGPLPSRLPVKPDSGAFPHLFRPLGVRTVRLVPKIVREQDQELECRGIDVRVQFLDGTEVAESELTFGQRRYLYAGIVFSFHPASPVLVDELDNGMHPDLVQALLELWRERQLFIVSHNKLVIDHTNFADPADVQAKVHIVRRENNGHQVITRLDDSAALEVYEKISVAIQSPSEVLQAEGLW